MDIRKYNRNDKDAVLQLLSLNTPIYFAPEEKDDLIFYLDNFADNYFVAENDGVLVGCGGFNLTDDRNTAKISWDIIDSTLHGQGIGRQLVTYRLQQILKIPSVNTVSVRTSQLVYPFYAKFGLVLREVVPDYWAKGFDLYRLDCGIDDLIII